MYLGNFKSPLVQTYRELSEADDSSLDDSNQRVLKHSDQKRLDGVLLAAKIAQENQIPILNTIIALNEADLKTIHRRSTQEDLTHTDPRDFAILDKFYKFLHYLERALKLGIRVDFGENPGAADGNNFMINDYYADEDTLANAPQNAKAKSIALVKDNTLKCALHNYAPALDTVYQECFDQAVAILHEQDNLVAAFQNDDEKQAFEEIITAIQSLDKPPDGDNRTKEIFNKFNLSIKGF